MGAVQTERGGVRRTRSCYSGVENAEAGITRGALQCIPDHNSPSQPKENSIHQNDHQEEIIHKLALQLKNIGDSIDHRMVPEDLRWEGREALAHFVLVLFGGAQALLRVLWNHHLM